MAEDNKERPPSEQKDSGTEKEPVPPVPQPAPAPASAPPPRPAPAVQAPPRPAAAPPKPPAPPAAPLPAQAPKSQGRRNFIKALAAVSAILAVLPFVPWSNYLLSSVSSSGALQRQKVVLDMNTATNKNANGAVAGLPVKVSDLTSFPENGTWLFTYPSSGDVNVDSQNPDTFQKWQLVRLPSQLGGSDAGAAAFVALSKVCVHLWCSPNYDPQKSTNPQYETYQCPCHGSIYEMPDGKAVAGPASLQAFPTNSIPMLTLTADSDGYLWVEKPVFDVEHNGVIGYGRDYASYQNYILPVAEGKVKP